MDLKQLIEERDELNERLKKLSLFIRTSGEYEDLSAENKSLIQQQILHMNAYFDTLTRRIASWQR